MCGYFLAALVINICFALTYKALCQGIQLRKVVRSIILTVAPVEAKPMNVFAYRIYVLDIFLDGVGVVKAQVAGAAEFFGYAEVHTYSLGMAYVQVAVGFGGEARVQASVVFAGLQVVIYYLFDKVHSFFLVGVVGLGIICHDVYVCCFCVCACMYIFMLASAFAYF